MRLDQIVSLREDALENYYVGLSKEQQDKFILIEDAPDGMLLISYSETNKTETIRPLALGLYAGTWDQNCVAVRIDSHRFTSGQEQLGDSQDVLEARLLCKKIQEKLMGSPWQDVIEDYLQELIFIIQNQEHDIEGLFVLNNELDSELNDLLPQPCIPSDELCPEPQDELNIYVDQILEPTQEEIFDKPENKTSTKASPRRKAKPKQSQP